MLGRMGLVGEALVLLSMLRRVLAVLCVLRGVWRVLLRVLAVGLVLRWMLPVLGVRSMLGMLGVLLVLWVLTVLAVLGVLAVRAPVLREVLRMGRAVARVGLGRMGQGNLTTVGGVAVRVAVRLVV